MEKLRALLEETLNEEMLRATISKKRHADIAEQIRIRPLLLRGELMFQCAVSDGKKEFHTNYSKSELTGKIETWLREDYKQFQMDRTEESIQALVNKKGQASIRRTKMMVKRQAGALVHNRKKRYILEEGKAVPFLVDLGVMTPEGKVVHARYDKFRQINRFLEFVEDILPNLARGRELTILDFGCGKSYLTFAMYYYLKILKEYDVRIIGLDLKEDVIEHCSALAKKYGYDKLTFLTGDIASYEGVQRVDMVVTLHACDTATDYALQKAVEWNADVILSVPCCQHELNAQMHSELMQPVIRYGVIRERMAALLTDALRADLLEEQGYQVQILEFIDMEHTPKNLLIRAVKKGRAKGKGRNTDGEIEARKRCMEAWGVEPLLEKLL